MGTGVETSLGYGPPPQVATLRNHFVTEQLGFVYSFTSPWTFRVPRSHDATARALHVENLKDMKAFTSLLRRRLRLHPRHHFRRA